MTTMLVPFMSCSAKNCCHLRFANRRILPSPHATRGNDRHVRIRGDMRYWLCRPAKSTCALEASPCPFVMELPNYRLPAAKSVARLVWDKAKGFIKKAFTVVLAACVIIWFLQTFDAHLNVVEDVDTSLLACIGGFIAPLFAPARLWGTGACLPPL